MNLCDSGIPGFLPHGFMCMCKDGISLGKFTRALFDYEPGDPFMKYNADLHGHKLVYNVTFSLLLKALSKFFPF